MSDQAPPPPPHEPGGDQPPAPGYWKASDGNWYPPQQQPAAQPQQFSQMPPTSSGGIPGWAMGCLIAIGVVAVFGVLAVACIAVVADEAVEEIDKAIEEQERNEVVEAADVELADCGVDTAGTLSASVRVTNNSSERSNYFIDIVFESPSGDQIESSFVTVSALEPGQSTTQDAITFTQPEGEFTCRVAEVDRLSDE